VSRALSTGIVGLLLLAAATAHAWSSSAKWAVNVVGYQVNPENLDVTSAQALAAIRYSADAWTEQTQAAFRFRYDGKSTVTKQGLDGKNLVLFRNEVGSSSTVRASTYTWKLGPFILETDIVFWDKSMTFVTGSMPCTKEIYIENTGIHEFGHALGLDHSDVSTATMWSKSSVCSKDRLTLDPDDIAGAEALYPCLTSVQCDDGDPCTKDTCNNKKCLRTAIAGCCNTNAECDDKDPCTKDTCSNNVCKNAPIAGCCTTSAECDDKDPCTKDTCKNNVCKHTPIACDAGPHLPDATAADGPVAAADAHPYADLAVGWPDAGVASDGAGAGGPVVQSDGCALAPAATGGGSRGAALLLLLLLLTRRRGRRGTRHRE
jgi:hypothetical protein